MCIEFKGKDGKIENEEVKQRKHSELTCIFINDFSVNSKENLEQKKFKYWSGLICNLCFKKVSPTYV